MSTISYLKECFKAFLNTIRNIVSYGIAKIGFENINFLIENSLPEQWSFGHTGYMHANCILEGFLSNRGGGG